MNNQNMKTLVSINVGQALFLQKKKKKRKRKEKNETVV